MRPPDVRSGAGSGMGEAAPRGGRVGRPLLGRVRDPEVLVARLADRIESIADPVAAGKILLDDLELRRVGARAADSLGGLRSERFSTLVDRPRQGATAPRSVGGGTAGAAERLPRSCPGLGGASYGPRDGSARSREDADLHRVRIEVERVRYAAEAFSPALGTRADRFAAGAGSCRTCSGSITTRSCPSRGSRRTGSARTTSVAFAAGRLAEYESMERDRRRDAWPKAWARLGRGSGSGPDG